MSKIEDVIYEFLSQPDIIADLINGMFFEGEQKVAPDMIHEIDGRLRAQLDKSGRFNIGRSKARNRQVVSLKRERDIVREIKYKQQSVIVVICGIELQSYIDNAMVLRNAVYDVLEYAKQHKRIMKRHELNRDVADDDFISKFTKDDRLIPTVTIVFYTGQKKWDAALTLSDLFDINPFTEKLMPHMINAPLNIISVFDVKDAGRFKSNLRYVFELLRYADDEKEFQKCLDENAEVYSSLDKETTMLIEMLVNMRLPEKADEGEEEKSMCKAIEDMCASAQERGKLEGKMEGKIEGKLEGIRGTVEILKKLGHKQDTIIEMLKLQFSLSEEEVVEYL